MHGGDRRRALARRAGARPRAHERTRGGARHGAHPHLSGEALVEREVLEFDVQFVGAGPAGLAGAIHLSNLIERHNQAIAAGAPGQAIAEVTIAVLEKAARVGAHGISGAVIDPRAIQELMPHFWARGGPLGSESVRT